MKYLINKNGEIFGFNQDGSQDFLITEDMKPITLEEIEELKKPTDEQLENERKQNIYLQISVLESKTYRPLREQLVGEEAEKLTASLILDNINKQIKNLRSQITATIEEQLLLNETLLVLKTELIDLRG